MKFALEIGQDDKHTLEFSFNQLLGEAVVRVDGREVFRKKRWFSEPLLDLFEFEIGCYEPVRVRIEKERKLLFASKYRIYIGNRLARLLQGI